MIHYFIFFIFCFQFCTSTKNPYWWQTKPEVSPPIAILEFKTKRKRVNEFSKPFYLSFDHPVPELITTHIGVTPRKPNITNNDKKYYNFEQITMYRIDVFKEEDYFIEFVDLGSSSLNVSIYLLFFPFYYVVVMLKATTDSLTVRV